MPGIISGLRKAKSAARKYIFGERGRWSESGTRRLKRNNGDKNHGYAFLAMPKKHKQTLSNANRTYLGRLKNWLGLKMFGSRIQGNLPSMQQDNLSRYTGTRTWLGRRKNNIERMLGLNRSRNNTDTFAKKNHSKHRRIGAHV
jgi:hypothetical protein